jgi:leucyl-tRNA synthetase
MDTFFDSSWYFLRYLSPQHADGPWDPELVRRWAPVHQYTGGAEHAIMHLLYARFFAKALRDMGLLEFDEPFLRLFNQGHIIAEGAKMSKSRGNVITPDPYVEELGADVVRTYLMFIGPWDHGGEWNDAGINGVARWFNRVWDLFTREYDGRQSREETEKSINRGLHQTIRKVHHDLDNFKFNTAIASLMAFTNALPPALDAEALSVQVWGQIRHTFLRLLAPIAPHLAEELWERLGEPYSIHQQPFPVWDDALAAEEQVTLVVQVNGRVRDRFQAPADIPEEEAKAQALARDNVRRHVGEREVAQVIYVSGRLVNVVTR